MKAGVPHMVLGPFPAEQGSADDFERVVAQICAHPRLYVTPATFGTVCAYLNGFDAARSGGPLVGLHQWMVVRLGDGNSVHWSGLARRLLPDGPAVAGLSDEERHIRALGGLLVEFFDYRRTNGLTK